MHEVLKKIKNDLGEESFNTVNFIYHTGDRRWKPKHESEQDRRRLGGEGCNGEEQALCVESCNLLMSNSNF